MNLSKPRLPLVTAFLGLAACLLRLCLYLFGTDSKGLLVTGHPLSIALWVLTAVAVIYIPLQVRKRSGKDSLHAMADFPVSLPMVGCFLFAAGLLLTVMANRPAYTTMELVGNISGLLAAAALIAAAVCRMQGKTPFFGFHGIVFLALTLHTIRSYRGWSSQPQLTVAFFPMMGCLALMLFSYYRTASDADMRNPGMQLGSALLAVFFCLAAIPESNMLPLYLTGSIWALTNLSDPTPRHNNKEENQ